MANTPCSAVGVPPQTVGSSPMSWRWGCKLLIHLQIPPFAGATAPVSPRPFCVEPPPASGKPFPRQPPKISGMPSPRLHTCMPNPMTAWATAFPIFGRRLSCSMRRERPRGPRNRHQEALIFPNPSSDGTLRWLYKGDEPPTAWQLFDAAGHLLDEGNVPAWSIAEGHFQGHTRIADSSPNGTYIFQLTGSDGVLIAGAGSSCAEHLRNRTSPSKWPASPCGCLPPSRCYRGCKKKYPRWNQAKTLGPRLLDPNRGRIGNLCQTPGLS